MEKPGRRVLWLGILCSGLFLLLTARALFFVAWGDTLYFELVGMRGVALEALCGPKLLAGIEGPIDHVHSDYLSSIFFLIPTKLFGAKVGVLLLNRLVYFLFYAMLLLLLTVICAELRFTSAVSVLLVIYLGLNEQTLASLLLPGLTLTMLTWLAWIVYAFVLTCKLSRYYRWRFWAWVAITPFSVMVGYEVYALARPLALVHWVFFFVWLLWRPGGVVTRTWRTAIFLGATALALSVFHWVHPAQEFNFSLFSARGESLVQTPLTLRHDVLHYLGERARELVKMFDWPDHSYLRHWGPPEITCRWLEVWIALLLLTLLHVGLRVSRGFDFPGLPRKDRAILLHWLILLGISLAVPLFAVTGMRGHRLAGVFAMSTLLTAYFLNHLHKHAPLVVRRGGGALAWLLAALFAIHQMGVLWRWKPAFIQDAAAQAHAIRLFERNPAPDGFADGKPKVLLVCNHMGKLGNEIAWELIALGGEAGLWKSVLYTTGEACRLSISNVVVVDNCHCSSGILAAHKASICVEQVMREGRESLSWYRPVD